jgi:hypothetical protein
MNTDRRDFAPFALKWFPTMEHASSDDWHFFMDKVTGLDTPLDMSNGQAFDRWRQALAEQGYPAFDYTATDIAAAKARAADMLAAEERRAASLGSTLEALAVEAPNWTAAEVLASTKG